MGGLDAVPLISFFQRHAMALFPLISLASIALVASEAPAPPLPPIELQPLLQRAAARLAAPEEPIFIETETEEDLDRRGRTTAVRICESEQTSVPGAAPHREVIEAFNNSYLVTGTVRKHKAEWERQAKAARAKLSAYLELTLPFEASQQGQYRFTAVGMAVGTAGPQVRVHFEPAGQGRRLWVGDATLDAASGTILQLLGHPAVLPRFVDYMNVHMEFDPTIAGPLPAKMVIEGSGHFLFFHKRMRYTSVTAVPAIAARFAGGN